MSSTSPLVLVVMGVAGSGKTLIARMLADVLNCQFWDADGFHSDANIARMRNGEALSDDDRLPWLLRLQQLINDCVASGEPAVVACSSLRATYRETLRGRHADAVRFVYLRGPAELFRARLDRRIGHFAGSALLDSQLATLEEPDDAIVVDAAEAPATILGSILRAVRLQPRSTTDQC